MTDVEGRLQSQLPYWDKLTEIERSTLISNAKLVQCSAGQSVRGIANEPGVILVQKGTLRTYLLSEEGRILTVHWPKVGDACAFSAAQITYSLDLELNIDAFEDSELLIIPADIFLHIADKNIYVSNYINEMSSRCFSYIVTAMQKVLFTSLDKRLLDFIALAVEEGGSLELHITHEQLAEAIGSSREVVSRALRRMSDEGLVEVFRGGLRILNRDGLLAETEV